jgi:hypothetical protein
VENAFKCLKQSPFNSQPLFLPFLLSLFIIHGMLNEKQLEFCKNYVSSGSAADAYKKAYKCKNVSSCRTNGSKLLKKEDVQTFIDKLRRAKEEQIIAGRKKEIEDLKEQVLHEIELDVMHSQICRGAMLVEEIYQVREYVPVQKDDSGQLVPGSGRWAVTFKRVTRAPNIREKQISSDLLYKRKGSYAPLKIRATGGANDADIEDADSQPEERYIILSNGNRLPFPNTNKGT